LTVLAKPVKIELMIGHLIASRLPYLLRPTGDVTKFEFDHMPTSFADNMMMVILQLTEFILHIRSIRDFENDSQGFKKIKRSIDGSEPNPSLSLDQRLKELLRT
jgi:hypothetical protein